MKKIIICLILASSLFILSPKDKMLEAVEQPAIFDKEATYSVYYEVSGFEVDYIDNVRVLGTVTMGNVDFLIIQSTDITNRRGYILLNSVKAILPFGSVKPNRNFSAE